MRIGALVRRALTFGRGVVTGMPADVLSRDPVRLFGEWFESSREAGIPEPDAMNLATSMPGGGPSARMVLLKSFDDRGFVFFTNYGSRKARELEVCPRAALTFYWQPLLRQVRIEGEVSRVDTEESRAYFDSRPRGSRIGAWASRQSEELDARSSLEARVEHYKQRFAGDAVPLPEFWGGMRVAPRAMEFWQGRASRLHDRVRFERESDDRDWHARRLYP